MCHGSSSSKVFLNFAIFEKDKNLDKEMAK
jgi:hypothetical protein